MGITAIASGCTHILGVTLETARHKLPERLREGALQGRWRVLGNEEQHLYRHASCGQQVPEGWYLIIAYLHGMQLCVRWLSFCKLNGGDSKTPDVGLVIVATLLDYLRRHPIWRPNESILLSRQGPGQLSRYTEVGKLDFAIGRKEDVGRWVILLVNEV